MRVVETKVYTFSELSEQAKEKAIEVKRDSLYNGGFYWGSEVLESIKQGLRLFGCDLSDYSIHWDNINRCYTKIDFYRNYEEEEELTGVRLWKYLHNKWYLTFWNKYQKKYQSLQECCAPFTGVCYDEDFLQPIREFVNKPDNRTFTELIEDCVYNCLLSGCDEWQYVCSDEGIAESLKESNNEYTDKGILFY